MSMASLESRPLDERNKALHIARMAFPTLFPTGAASFNSPREISVKLAEYHLHLMRYRDDRFARHPQFRFWALNTQMRQQALSTSKWCTNRTAENMVDIETLRDMASKDDSLLPKMFGRKATNLRGIRPFWQNKSRELEALVRDRNADLFATASPADMQWSDLYRHMPDCEWANGATEEERRRLNFRLLQENPHIAATYLYRRWNLFFRHVLKKVFDIDDHWFRYEWQARGSGHIHGLYWTKDSPQVNKPEEYLSYWGQLVTAVNPDGGLPAAPVHPCSRPFATRKNTRQELAEVVNCCQRHTQCSEAYCLRKRTGDQRSCMQIQTFSSSSTSQKPEVNN